MTVRECALYHSRGGDIYGTEDLGRLYGGSGGGGGNDVNGNREGAGGGGSGGSILLTAPSMYLSGDVSAAGGTGGLDDDNNPEIKNEGGRGGDGRVRFISDDLHVTDTAVFSPDPVRSDLGAWQAPDGAVSIGEGEVMRFHTDGYDTFTFTNLTIAAGGTLTAVGTRPLIIESTGTCAIDGLVDVSGGDGVPGQNLQSGAGGGAGAGAVKISCDRIIISDTGSILANGGDGGRANDNAAGHYRGTGGIGIAGGNDGGATGQPGFGLGNDGLGPEGGVGGTQVEEDIMPPGAGGGGYGTFGESGSCDALHGDCETVGGQTYGDAELSSLVGGSGGGGGSNPPGKYEGPGGGGSGGSIFLEATTEIVIGGLISAVGGGGGLDDQSTGCELDTDASANIQAAISGNPCDSGDSQSILLHPSCLRTLSNRICVCGSTMTARHCAGTPSIGTRITTDGSTTAAMTCTTMAIGCTHPSTAA